LSAERLGGLELSELSWREQHSFGCLGCLGCRDRSDGDNGYRRGEGEGDEADGEGEITEDKRGRDEWRREGGLEVHRVVRGD